MNSQHAAAGIRTFGCPTSWGQAWVTTLDDHVIEVAAPGVRLSGGGQSLDEAPRMVVELAARMRSYFSGVQVDGFLDPQVVTRALELNGIRGFSLRVLTTMMEIPYGEVVSYGELAGECGSPGASRAVGTVCAHNPLPIVIPCHRVVRAGGQIGQYGGLGPEGKLRLLRLERIPVDEDRMFVRF